MGADFAAIRREEFPAIDGRDLLQQRLDRPAAGAGTPARSTSSTRSAPRRFGSPTSDLFAEFDRARELTARLLNVTPAEIALTFNTSYGLNLAAGGLPLEPGDIVLASDREFPANVYPWLRLKERGITARARAGDRERLARRGPPGRADGRPEGAGGGGVAGPVQQRLQRGPRPALEARAGQRTPSSWWTRSRGWARCRWISPPRRWTSCRAAARSGCSRRGAAGSCTCGGSCSRWCSRWSWDGWRSRAPTTSPGSPTTTRASGDDAKRFEMISLPFQDFAGYNTSLELLLEVGIPAIAAHIAARARAGARLGRAARRADLLAGGGARVGHRLRGRPEPRRGVPRHPGRRAWWRACAKAPSA